MKIQIEVRRASERFQNLRHVGILLIFATMDGTVATIICLSSWGFGSKNVAAQVDPSKLQYDV
jgi:N6-adenosine-specific RNA methylase IME4